MAFIFSIYTQIICAAALYFTSFNHMVFFVFISLYFAAGFISSRYQRMSHVSRPLVYNCNAVWQSLLLANISFYIVAIISLFVDWLILPLTLVVFIIARSAFTRFAEWLLVFPVYSVSNK